MPGPVAAILSITVATASARHAAQRRQGAKIVGLDGQPLARYDAANVSRRTAGWEARASGPNAEIGSSLSKLRDRHRDLARNNPWARRAIAAVVTNTVGDGLRAQWQDPAVQQLWDDWFGSTDFDADGRLDGYGATALVMRGVVESGEVLARKRWRRTDDALSLPLQVQILEGDFLDHNKTELTLSGNITQGVEFDARGRRIAYWLYPEHPGDPIGRAGLMSERYAAADFAHVYRLDRPGQVRGVPWGTGSMLRLRMLDDYQDAQLERQRLAACYMAFRRVPDPTLTEGQGYTDEYQLYDKLQPGAVEDLPPGWDVSFASPPQPEDDKEFQLSILRACAADYGIPYEILTGDLSQVNFSSARMGFNEFSRNIDSWRWQMLAVQWLNPVTEWFRQSAALVGLEVRQPRPLWTAPARVMVDATREVPAMIKAIRAGLVSAPQAIRSQGYDPDILLAEQAEWNAKLNAAGVLLDTDPRADTARKPVAKEETPPND